LVRYPVADAFGPCESVYRAGMRLADDDDQLAFRTALRHWLRARVPPADPDTPRHRDLADLRAWSTALSDAGYAGLGWPAEHGGQGRSAAYQPRFRNPPT
jgi:alkylation response protein AidB-like acyl-CoA dehydrogenase